MPGDSSVTEPTQTEMAPETIAGDNPSPAERSYAALAALFCMIAPNLVWILTDRTAWISDTSLYAISALDLQHSLALGPREWVGAMLNVQPKPPILPWIGQFLVPVGRVLGNVDRGLLLTTYLAQLIGLSLLFRALSRIAGKRLAIVGCLVVAAAPVFVGPSRQFYVQPVQFAAVCWFIYIMVRANHWDALITLSHLVAASSLAMLTIMSSPVYCVAPGGVALAHAWKNRTRRFRLTWRHYVGVTLALISLGAAMAWYGVNHETAMEYSRIGYTYRFSSFVPGEFLAKLGQWNRLFIRGVGLAWILWIAVGAAVIATVRDRKPDDHGMAIAVLFSFQIAIVLVVMATSAQQTYRYVLPLVPYFAYTVVWSLKRLNLRWLPLAMGAGLLGQLWFVNHRSWTDADANRNRERAVGIAEGITQIVETNRPRYVLIGTGHFQVFGPDAEFHAAKRPGYYINERPTIFSIEFMIINADGDLDRVWEQIVDERPEFVVIMSDSARLEERTNPSVDLAAGEDTWYSEIILGTLDVSDRIASSDVFTRTGSVDSLGIDVFQSATAE